jgi:NAD+ kinase
LSKTVGLLINETKPAAVEAARELAAFLENSGVSVLSQDAIATLLQDTGCHAVPTRDDVVVHSDFIVVFGGDGTLLAACRTVAPHGKPILAAHLGHFGFLTQVSPEGLRGAVERVLADHVPIEERGMLQAQVRRAGSDNPSDCETLLGMNDVVVASGVVRLIYVQTKVGDELLATYAADGVIVATPTGSTGYSLSAGGPLVHPSAPVFVIAPISPHTLSARPMVIPNTETVSLCIEPHRTDTSGIASIDGQIEVEIAPGDIVTVSQAPYNVKFLRIGDSPSFYEKIRTRWHYGERQNAG